MRKSLLKKHHTPKRLWNLLRVRPQLLLRTSRVVGYPTYLVVESTNICNLKCPLCPTGQGLKGRAKGKMPFPNFKKIIDEIGDYLYSLRLENWGEPLLNEEICDMVSYAKSKKINTSFNTNLHFLNEQSAERLILSGLDHIKISLDGARKDSYAKYRIGGDFNKIVNNIKLLVEMRQDLNRTNPFIEIQFIVMKHNEGEIDQIKQLSGELGVDGLLLEELRPGMEEELLNPDSYCIEKYKNWLPTNSKYSCFDYKSKKRKNSPRICSYLWTTSVINWDGSVVPCCSVYDEKYNFGNIFYEGFQKIWNGSKYGVARKLIGHRKKCNEEVVCMNCFKYGIIA